MKQQIPEFLASLDDHPREAADQFAAYFHRFLAVTPPRVFRRLSNEDQKDLRQDLILHFVRNNFRQLRAFRQIGRSFDAWLSVVVNAKTIDFLRKKSREALQSLDIDSDEIAKRARSLVDQQKGVEDRQMLDIVSRCLAELTDRCRLLLRLASEEYTPAEIQILMGHGADSSANKKISNDLQYCRKKLRDKLFERGVDLEW